MTRRSWRFHGFSHLKETPRKPFCIPFSLLQGDPRNVPALIQLASVLADMGDAERLAPVAARLMAEAPSDPWAHYYAATLAFLQNRPDQALREARAAVAMDPSHAKAHNLIGRLPRRTGPDRSGPDCIPTSLKADPRESGTYTNLATLELQSGNRGAAIRYFAEALTVDPNNASAREGLTSALGHPIR